MDGEWALEEGRPLPDKDKPMVCDLARKARHVLISSQEERAQGGGA